METNYPTRIGSTGRLLKYKDIWIPALEIDNDEDERSFFVLADALTEEEYKILSMDIDKFEYLSIRNKNPIVKVPTQNKVFLDRLDYFLAVQYGPDPTLVVSKDWFRKLILQHSGRYYFELISDITPWGLSRDGYWIEPTAEYHIQYHSIKVNVVESGKLPDKIQAMNTRMGNAKGCMAWTIDNRLIDEFGS